MITSVSAVPTIENVKPQVTAVFQEKVVIIDKYLVNTETGKDYTVKLVFSKDDLTFTFVPDKALSNGIHRLTIFASDLVGNSEVYTYEFEVFVPGTRIFLIEPNSIGFANSTTFPVTIYTSRSSVCKYTGISVSDFDDIRLKFFDSTGNVSSGDYVNDHTINAYTVEPDFPKKFYVACKDDLGRENFEMFTLYADVTPPTLKSIIFNPSPVVEYPPEGDLKSTLQVTASEPVQCKYSKNGSTPYEDMVAFDDFDINDVEAFHDINSQLMTFPGDIIKETLNFYVQCEDRARFRSARLAKPITIDLTAGLQIKVVTPPAFSGVDKVFLNITTNRRAECFFKSLESGTGDPTTYTVLSTPSGGLDTTHLRDLGVKSEGAHPISIRCEVPEGVGLEAMTATKDYTYSIDKTPPGIPVINATTPVCGNSLSADFFANDSMSGIATYVWAVGAAGTVFANGTTVDDSISVSQYNNGSSFELDPAVKYVFSVSAIDGAGNEGKAGISNQITFDATGTTCDHTPPTITLIESESGDSVEIQCQDDASGCTSIGSFYGTSYVQPCNSTQYFLDPVTVPLFKTTIICWEIKDNAGNVAVGSQIVDVNTSVSAEEGAGCAGGIDGDGDGYGERCPLGPDCDDTDPDWTVGCANGCISDLDGDGFGKGCTNGNDCHGRNANLTDTCPNNCISDNDGDEFGLGCDNGPDCKGDDSSLTINCPNGCVDDNDGDRYGLGCPAGFDCDGEDYNKMMTCDTLCIQDTDGDTFGVGCSAGLDCNGRHPTSSLDCDNGCVFDEDGDGYGFGCTKGLDCNGMHPLLFQGCSNGCVSDNDGDGYGWECSNGADCNDTDPFTNLDCSMTTDCVFDHDGDGYGLGCIQGPDCDDFNPLLAMDGCTANCTYDEDCNGLPDFWQEKFFNSTVCDDPAYCGPDADPDGDGYSNIEEYRRNTNPLEKDEVYVPPTITSESDDADGDNMPDACERMYGLNPSDPFDGENDKDGDGLKNEFECSFKEGSCVNWLNPTSPDTDNDGYEDGVELDAGTDPCDPDSHPGPGLFPILLIILGVLMNIGSTGYLIYKRYYIPLVSPPPKPAAVPRAAPQRAVARPAGAPSGVHHHHYVPRHLAPRRPSGPAMSRDLLQQELEKRAKEREKILGVFGERKKVPHKPSKIMQQLARKPIEIHRRVPGSSAKSATKPAPKTAPPPQEDYVNRLTKVVGNDYFDKIAGLSKEEADYMGKLAKITKKKDIPIEEDHVDKLAKITQKVSEDPDKKRELVDAFKKSDMDNLDSFLTSRKQVDTFIKEQVPEEKGAFDALESLSSPKRKEVIGALDELSSQKAKDTAMSKMDALSGAASKAELIKEVTRMSKDKHVDKNVFEVLLSYLLKSGKITKKDVSEILFDLEQQGVMDKNDVSEVFFNIGIKK